MVVVGSVMVAISIMIAVALCCCYTSRASYCEEHQQQQGNTANMEAQQQDVSKEPSVKIDLK